MQNAALGLVDIKNKVAVAIVVLVGLTTCRRNHHASCPLRMHGSARL